MYLLRLTCPALLKPFTALLPYCPTALLPYCPTALLPYCPTALLPYCPTALLPYRVSSRNSRTLLKTLTNMSSVNLPVLVL